MAVGVSEAACTVFLILVGQTTFSKSVTSTGSSDIPAVQTLLDTLPTSSIWQRRLQRLRVPGDGL